MPSESKSPSIFISHAGPDIKWATWVRYELLAFGYDVELATMDWSNSSYLAKNVQAAFEKNDAILCLLSNHYFQNGRWTLDELESAWSLRRNEKSQSILLFLIDDITVPPPYNGVIVHALHNKNEKRAVDVLKDEVAKVLGNACGTPRVLPAKKPAYPNFSIKSWLPSDRATSDKSIDELLKEGAKYVSKILHSSDNPPLPEEIRDYENLVQEYARAYNYTAPANIYRTALDIGIQIKKCMDIERRPSMMRRLLELLSRISGILSYAAQDLGDSTQARSHSVAMGRLASLAEAPELEAWALGTESLILRFQGRNLQALDAVKNGLQKAFPECSKARLHGQASLCYATLGDVDNTCRHIELSEKSIKEGGECSILSDGIFLYGEAKHHYYAGIAHLSTGRLTDSAMHTRKAIACFNQGNPDSKSLSDNFLAHIHLATANLRLGNFQELLDNLAPVFELPLEYRTSWHKHKLWRLRDEFATRCNDEDIVNRISADITQFSEEL